MISPALQQSRTALQAAQQRLQQLKHQHQQALATGIYQGVAGIGQATQPIHPLPTNLTLASREPDEDGKPVVHSFTINLTGGDFEITWSSHHPLDELKTWRELLKVAGTSDNMACGCLKTLAQFMAWSARGWQNVYATATASPPTFIPPQWGLTTSTPYATTISTTSNTGGLLQGLGKLFTSWP